MKPYLIYLLHSGQMFGTERMALGTLQALRSHFDPLVMAPPGPVHAAARAEGMRSVELHRRLDLPRALAPALAQRRDSVVLATGVVQSVWTALLRRLVGAHGAHLHVVHGGTDERLSYGRKHWLAPLDVRFVAVSAFVRERLVAHGVPAQRIQVVHNFLTGTPPAVRPPFTRDGVRRVVMLSRLDRIKRVGLLLDALARVPGLAALQFDLYGSGEEEQALRQRAQRFPNVRLHGYVPDAAQALSGADLLLHTCPEEPFGLVLLEAFAAGVPVLVPNSGGAGGLVHDGVNGWHFSANDPVALGLRLRELRDTPAPALAAVAQGGRAALAVQFDARRQAARYLALAGAVGAAGARR